MAPPRTGAHSLAVKLLDPPFDAVFYSEDGSPHNTQWQTKFEGYTTVLPVRHPYTRAVSLWRWGCFQAMCQPVSSSARYWRRMLGTGLPNLDGFLQYPELVLALNTAWRCSWHLERLPEPVTHVLHLEQWEQDLARVPQFEGLVFPQRHAGPPSKYPWHYFYEQLPEAAERVQRLWADDFDEFGYNYDLAQCRDGKFLVDS